jgi:hypothetical protein
VGLEDGVLAVTQWHAWAHSDGSRTCNSRVVEVMMANLVRISNCYCIGRDGVNIDIIRIGDKNSN